jgi:hypothetical protein
VAIGGNEEISGKETTAGGTERLESVADEQCARLESVADEQCAKR